LKKAEVEVFFSLAVIFFGSRLSFCQKFPFLNIRQVWLEVFFLGANFEFLKIAL
jgi:hypothetical protein